MSINQIKQITKQIGKAIAQPIDKDNPDEVAGKIAELSNLLASSSHAVALSEMLYNERLSELVQKNEYSNLNATEKKMLFAGLAKHEIYYCTLSERQNKALTHQIDGLRSIISYLKSEMQNISS